MKGLSANAAYLDAAKALYGEAIDPRASDGEGEAWWWVVADELAEVIAAPRASEAAAIIAWWHREWGCVNDTPRAAAARIRRVACAQPGARRVLLAGVGPASLVGDTDVADR